MNEIINNNRAVLKKKKKIAVTRWSDSPAEIYSSLQEEEHPYRPPRADRR